VVAADFALRTSAIISTISGLTGFVEAEVALIAIAVRGAFDAGIIFADQAANTIAILNTALTDQFFGVADLGRSAIGIFTTTSATGILVADLAVAAICVVFTGCTGVV
jgi:hypothetical protein